MRIHKLIGKWVVDYYYLSRATMTGALHKDPPEHFLGYVLPGKPPIIIIPGILQRWGTMSELANFLSKQGYPIYIVPKLRYNLYSIPMSSLKVRAIIAHVVPKIGHLLPRFHISAKLVRELIREYKIHDAIILAHSKGGLIGKYLLAYRNKDKRVKGMVSIATPYSGSALAKLIPHKSFKELLEDSKIVEKLESHTAVNKKIISIYPEFDNHVWAKNGSYLDGALDNICVPVSGHHYVLYSKKVKDVVKKSLERISKLK